MIKTLRRQGNGQVLPVDKATMDAMGIDLETPLQVTVTGNTLVVTPVHAGVSEQELARIMHKKGRTSFNPLIKWVLRQ